MKIKGFMYDMARGMRGDADYIENILRRLAEYGYNMLVINLEYRFKYPSHPGIGPADSLSPEDIKKLDKTARELGIELVPFVNCAGHNEGILILEKYKHLGADPSGVRGMMQQILTTNQLPEGKPEGFSVEQMLVGNEEAIELMLDLYGDLMDCFSSKYFHIGFDEVRQMHVQMPDSTEEERFGVVFGHLQQIVEFVRSKGRIPMLWCDMFANHPERQEYIGKLPKDVIICDWHYSGEPYVITLKMDSQTLFKRFGYKSVICPAVNGFRGNPVLCEQSTENIRKLNTIHKDVHGDNAEGVLLCSWETNFGGCFSAHWPWIFLQGLLFEGKDTEGYGFLREYTKREWGMDNDLLFKWYELVDSCVVESVIKHIGNNEEILQGPKKPVASGLLNRLKRSVFRTANILQSLQNARNWLKPEAAAEIIGFLDKAKEIAAKMYECSANRKEEPLRLLEWNKAYISIFKLMVLIEKLNEYYTLAAVNQGTKPEAFREYILKCVSVLADMLKETEPMKKWAETTVLFENNAVEEKWWIDKAQKELEKRISAVAGFLYNDRTLVNFNRFVRFDADIPNRVFNR
jgi:hypothetical protein